MPSLTILSCLLPLFASLGTGQVQGNYTVWSSVVVTRFGDRIPLLSPELSILTPLGAQQLFSAGQHFRERYVSPPVSTLGGNLVIPGISAFNIDNTQVFPAAVFDPSIEPSAQAFLQGLYPPTNTELQGSLVTDSFVLANGSKIQYPLGNYQYPFVATYYKTDSYSVWLAGTQACPAHQIYALEYYQTIEAINLRGSTQVLYDRLYNNVFAGDIVNTTISYENAYDLYEYLAYLEFYNKTVQDRVTADDLTQAQSLASKYVNALYGNTSSKNHISTIAGTSLATYLLGNLFGNIESSGANYKLSLLFTSYEPLISLAALLRLPPWTNGFFGIPAPGSSMVFELYSENSDNSTSAYPLPENLLVRFLFRNGTDSTANLNAYPIFGRSDNDIAVPFNDFVVDMESIMLTSTEIGPLDEWCTICGSMSVFCPASLSGRFTNTTVPSSGSSEQQTKGSGISPAVAGVSGGIIALVVDGVVAEAALLLFGVRFFRLATKRRSELGGFKGAEKLASDPDLTAIKASGVGASVVGKGHERIGSWELTEGALGKVGGEHETRKRGLDEEISEQFGEPVKVSERV